MLRAALIWLAIIALCLGGVASPVAAPDAPADGLAGMGGGESLRALPMSVRPVAALTQWLPAGDGGGDHDAIVEDAPAWRELRDLPGAPPARPVPIVPSDPEAPGTGAVVG